MIFKRILKGNMRNKPCYCGSGSKYKKCHYLIDGAANEATIASFRVTEAEKKLINLIK